MRVLHFDRAAHRVDHAAELDDAAVAGALDDAAVMDGDCRIDQIAAQRAQSRQSPIFVRAGEPAVADDIRDQNRRNLPGLAHRAPRTRCTITQRLISRERPQWVEGGLSIRDDRGVAAFVKTVLRIRLFEVPRNFQARNRDRALSPTLCRQAGEGVFTCSALRSTLQFRSPNFPENRVTGSTRLSKQGNARENRVPIDAFTPRDAWLPDRRPYPNRGLERRGG